MMTYRVGAAGASCDAARMADHLLQQTQPREMMERALYYQRGMAAAPNGLSDQTMPEPRRDMAPEVASILGIDLNKPLDRDEIASLLNGQRADGADIPGKSKRRATDEAGRNGYVDFCFSADKSVSVAWAFAETEAERNILVQAHRDAVDSAMRYIEKQIAWATKGDGGKKGQERGRVGWVKFDHYTSRATLALRDDGKGKKSLVLAKDDDPRTGKTEMIDLKVPGDPNLHTHVAVPNMVLTESGRVGALNLQKINGRIKEFGAVYQAYLATNLRRAGVEVVLDEKRASARLTAIPDHVRDAFSKRTRDAYETARQYAQDMGLDWDTMSDDGRVRFLKGGAHGSRQTNHDDISDMAAWRQQADALSWTHTSVIDRKHCREPVKHEHRIPQAHTAALPFVEEEFTRRSVITAGDIRTASVRGLIATGIERDGDIDDVTALMREVGVRQDGKRTDLLWGRVWSEKGQEQVQITTNLHVSQERELIAIAQKGAADRSAALNIDEINAAAERAGLDFSDAHGAAQRSMMEKLGTSGRVAIAIGVAGSGKSSIIRPLVDVWKSKGHKVYGTALAWRQSDDLGSAGIDTEDRAALDPFIRRAKRGTIKLDPKSVVVLDELGLVGVRQMLDLMRLQKKHGFTLVAVGDERQCRAIEAGPVIELMRKALGKEAVPEILSTIRQKIDGDLERTERERTISLMFRDGKAEQALALKKEDGTVELVEGGRRETIERVVDLWQERHAANAHDPNFTLSISAPSNADAMEISAVLRERRRTKGEVEQDQFIISATDQQQNRYDLPLAVGDRVRLFDRVNASFGDRGGVIGKNGSVLEVRALSRDAITLRTKSGLVGRVKWDTLRDRKNGKIRLAYGDVGTIDSLQGSTSTEHIDALPGGSKTVQQGKVYVAESRHRHTSWMIVSEGAERQEIVDRRSLGDPRPIRDTDIWENMARNLSRDSEKLAAVEFLERAEAFRRGAVRAFQEGAQQVEHLEVSGLEPTTLRRGGRDAEEVGQVAAVANTLGKAVGQRQAAMDDFESRLQAFEQAMAATADYLEEVAPEHILEAIGATEPGALPDAPDWAEDGGDEVAVTPKAATSGKKTRTPTALRRFNPIPKDHLDALKSMVRLSDLIGQTVQLEKAGHEFKACCPLHDERTASFYVNDKQGTYHCFGCNQHGDAISWLGERHGMEFHDAVKYLEDRSGISLPEATAIPRVAEPKGPEWKPVFPVPEGVPPLITKSGRTAKIFNPKQEGQGKEWATYRPQHVAEYRDAGDHPMGYVIRVEIKAKDAAKDRKFTPQVTWVVPSNTPANADMAKVGRWALWSMGDRRPLYHAEKLALNPDAPVIVVAGEKKADLLQDTMKDAAVVVSWAGGDHARRYVDFSPLRGRTVTFWPDADTSGIKAAFGEEDRGNLKEGACSLIEKAGADSVNVVVPPSDLPKGWDCGDLVKDGKGLESVYDFLDQHSHAYDRAAHHPVEKAAREKARVGQAEIDNTLSL